MNGYYSVFNPDGDKIADCGAERDALFLIHSRNRSWDGHYYTFIPLPGDIINVNQSRQFEPYVPVVSIADDIVVNVDEVQSQPVLEQSDAEVFIPE